MEEKIKRELCYGETRRIKRLREIFSTYNINKKLLKEAKKLIKELKNYQKMELF